MEQRRSDPDRRKKRRKPAVAAAGAARRSGTVALIGRPNVGKSTLLNAALDQPLAIVSPMPQTTRDALLGVVHHGAAELAILDTPGLHRPRTELGRVMNQTAREASRAADVVVFVTEIPEPKRARMPHAATEPAANARAPMRPLSPHPGDLTLLADVGADKPTVLVVNKIDRLRDKSLMLPFLEAFSRVRNFAAVVPISALRESGIERVLDEVAGQLPEGAWRYGPDELTDRPVRFFAAEYVREQILRATQAEVPHAVAVAIDRFVEPAEGDGAARPGRPPPAIHIDATVLVERPGQKAILIGRAGEMLKRIGTEARLRIEELTGRKVNLKLWVRVVPQWRQSRHELEELGYAASGGAVAELELGALGPDDEIEGGAE